MKGNVIQLNTLHLNSVRLNGIGEVQSVSLKGGSTEDPVFPPVEPPVEPTPTYTLSASVTNGKVSATKNGSAVNLPFTANEGDTIVVEVTPDDGYSFEGWADGNTDNPRTITMTADVVLSAQCVEVAKPPVGNYIQFEDPAVEAICVANWSSDGIGLTEEDAAAVTSIGTTFKGNTDITSFDEFAYFTKVISLEFQAFAECSSLESIVFPPNLLTSGGQTFLNNTSLANIDFANMQKFSSYAFKNIGAEVIDLPSSAIEISTQTFAFNKKLQTIIVRATTPPALTDTSIAQCPLLTAIYVPDASVEAYKTATNWNTYADRIHPLSEIEGSPYIQFEDAEVERELMANGVSSDGIGITKEDAAAVTTIGTWFKGNTAITSFNELKYFTGVTELSASAMQNCSALVSANLDNIQYLRGSSLNNTGIDKMYLPSVKTISGSALSSCKFSVILLGKNLTNIENYAIRINSILHTAICLAETPPTFGSGNFTSVNALAAVYVPDASVETYKTASGWSGVASKFKALSQLATDNPSLYSEIEKYL